MKKLMFGLFFALILVLGACGGGGDEGAQEDTTEEQAMDEGAEDSSGDAADEGTEEGMDSTEDGGDSTVNAQAAEEAFNQNNCTSCHGGDLGGGFGPALTDAGSKYSSEEIVDIIKNGKGSMPAQESVSDEDAQLIAGWLATMK